MARGQKKLRVAVIGVGHLGRVHARVYSEMSDTELVGVVDIDRARADSVAESLGTRAFYDHKDVIETVDAVSVVVPTKKHYSITKDFLNAGVHTIVEKPMTRTVEHAEDLVRIARQKNCVLQVGHIERFNPAVIAVRDLIKEPRFIECDRIGRFSFRSVDIGAVLDLMIHDLDIVLAFVKSEPVEVEAIGVPVFGAHEDMASARIKFENGCLAYLRASRISDRSMRKIRIFQPDVYISINYAERRAQVFRKKKVPSPQDLIELQKKHSSIEEAQEYLFNNLLDIKEVPIEEDEEPLKMELSSFLTSVREGKPPVVSGELGLCSMRLAYRILDSIQENRNAASIHSDMRR